MMTDEMRMRAFPQFTSEQLSSFFLFVNSVVSPRVSRGGF